MKSLTRAIIALLVLPTFLTAAPPSDPEDAGGSNAINTFADTQVRVGSFAIYEGTALWNNFTSFRQCERHFIACEVNNTTVQAELGQYILACGYKPWVTRYGG